MAMVMNDTNMLSTKYLQFSAFIYIHSRHAQPTFPDVSWEPLNEVEVVDMGVGADPRKKNLLSAASKCITLTPAIGTELHGIDLRQLTDPQRDEL